MELPDNYCKEHFGGDPQLEALMTSLPFNQGGEGRHKCPYCAYYEGYEVGFNSNDNITSEIEIDFNDVGRSCKKHKGGAYEMKSLMSRLLFNQGGTGRHRCPYCAYIIGFNAGIRAKQVIKNS